MAAWMRAAVAHPAVRTGKPSEDENDVFLLQIHSVSSLTGSAQSQSSSMNSSSRQTDHACARHARMIAIRVARNKVVLIIGLPL